MKFELRAKYKASVIDIYIIIFEHQHIFGTFTVLYMKWTKRGRGTIKTVQFITYLFFHFRSINNLILDYLVMIVSEICQPNYEFIINLTVEFVSLLEHLRDMTLTPYELSPSLISVALLYSLAAVSKSL